MNPQRLFLLSSSSYLYDPALPIPFDLGSLRMAYITTASKGAPNTAYVERMRDHLKKQNIAHEEIDLDGKNSDELRKALADKEIVFVEGGNAFYLMNSIRQSGFESVLKESLSKGLIYMSACAGTHVATPTLKMANWRQKPDYPIFGVTDMHAMNLVPFLVALHYDPQKKDLLDAAIAKVHFPTKTLSDREAIYIAGGNVQMLSDN